MPTLTQLQERLTAIRARLDELRQIDGDLTEEQRTEWRTLLDEGRTVTAALDQARSDQDALDVIMNATSGVQLRDIAGRAVQQRAQSPADRAQVAIDSSTDLPAGVVDFNGARLSDRAQRVISSPDYLNAWTSYIRRAGNLDELERRTLQEGLDQAGGYLVPPTVVASVITPETRPSGLFGEVVTMPVSSLKLQWPRNNWSIDNGNDTYSAPYRKSRTGETGAPTSQTAIPFGMVEIDLYEGSMEVPITRSILADAAIPVDAYVRQLLVDNFNQDTERELAVALGVNTPAGITRNPGGAGEPPVVNMGNPVTAGGYFSLHYALPAQYRQTAVYVMNDFDTFRTHAQLTDASNAYVFGVQSRNDGMQIERSETVFNRRIVFNPHMASPGANANVVAFGDFRKAYLYALHTGMTLQVQDLPRDAQVYMVLRFRDGGRFINPRAVRIGRQA